MQVDRIIPPISDGTTGLADRKRLAAGHVRQLLSGSAQRSDLMMGVMLVHFGARVAGELLADFHSHASVCHDACECMAETVEA